MIYDNFGNDFKRTEEFRQALFDTYVTEYCSAAQEAKLWELAYEYGHASGYSEIESYYIDLSDIINCRKV